MNKRIGALLAAGLLFFAAGCGHKDTAKAPADGTAGENIALHASAVAETSEGQTQEDQTFSMGGAVTGEASETESVGENIGGTAGTPVDPAYPHTLKKVDLDVDSEGWCVLNADGSIYMANNEFAPFAPASITKVLTALVTVEWVGMDDVVTVTESEVRDNIQIMSSGVSPSLKPGEKFTVRDLLNALLLSSTNAAGNVLADYVAGSNDAFAGMMNRKCEELGLTHSQFLNPHGLDTPGHYTCAYDMAVILKAACENEEVRKIMSSVSYKIPATEYSEERVAYMGHAIVNGTRAVNGVYAGKSGNTRNAGATLVTAVSREGKDLYVCTMHSDDKQSYEDTENLIEYAYASMKGEPYQGKVICHDIRIKSVDEKGMTFSFSIGNPAVSARMVYWDMAKGTDSAKFLDLPAPEAHMEKYIEFPHPGAYNVQVFATGVRGEEYGKTEAVFFTGKPLEPGMMQYNGCMYVIDDNGMLTTGTAETADGIYSIYSDGSVGHGFVGGRFYAGADGRIVTGWIEVNGEKFYCQADGRLATGRMIIDGTVYTFNENGALQK